MKIIQKGRWGNSDVYMHEHGEDSYIVKTFASHPSFIRNTIGRFLISREFKALKKLLPCVGTCSDVIRVGSFTLSYRYIEGKNLSSWSRRNNTIHKDFFVKLEAAVKEMHSYGIVHLDLRTGSNVIISDDGNPLILDFQSYLTLGMIPGNSLKNFLKQVDLSGVYKYWAKMSPETLDPSKLRRLESSNKKRKLWFLKGYMIQKMIKANKKKLNQNKSTKTG